MARERRQEPAPDAAASGDSGAQLRSVSSGDLAPDLDVPGLGRVAELKGTRLRPGPRAPERVLQSNLMAQRDMTGAEHQFIVLEGPIGVGKTSLARRLPRACGAAGARAGRARIRSSSASTAIRAPARCRRSCISCSSARSSSPRSSSRTCSRRARGRLPARQGPAVRARDAR